MGSHSYLDGRRSYGSACSRPGARGAGDRPARRARGSARRGGPSRTRRPGDRPSATSAARRAGSSSSARSAARSASASPGGTSSASRSARDTVAVAVDVGRHERGVPAAIASSSTTPNDSPSSAGKHAMVAPRRRACFSSSRHPPEPLDPRHPAPAQRVVVAGRRRRPRGRRHARGRRTRRAAPPGPSGARAGRRRGSPARPTASRGRRRGWATSTPFGRISHSPPKVWVTWRLASSETAVDTARRRIIGLQAGPEGLVPAVAAGAGGVERADRGEGGADERGVVGPGRQGLVEVEHVGLERAQRLDGAPGDGPAAGDRRHRAVAGHPGARPDGGDAGLGRRAVAGSDDAGVDARAARSARASPST